MILHSKIIHIETFNLEPKHLIDSPVKRPIESFIVKGTSSRGRPKKSWLEQIKNDLSELHLSEV